MGPLWVYLMSGVQVVPNLWTALLVKVTLPTFGRPWVNSRENAAGVAPTLETQRRPCQYAS
jgi:hypothetical protein